MATSSIMTTIWTEKRILQHPFHEHALTLRELSKDCFVLCSICEQYFQDGPTYCCEDCNFILHEACALIEFPPVIEEHPYHHHPGQPLNLVLEDMCYWCSGCGFSLDVLTALATRLLPQGVEEEAIHVLRFLNHLEEQRSFPLLIHEVCARLDLEIQHPLHRQHPLTLLMVGEHTNGMSDCKVCTHTVVSPPAYCCKGCGFVLHLKCTVSTMHSSSSAIEHYSHKHPLTPLHVMDILDFNTCCQFCSLMISGSEIYACSDCSFFVHKSCGENLPEEILQHPFHPQHPRLVLHEEGSGKCKSCSGYIASGVAFSCGDCDFNLHRACALEPLSSIEDGEASYISHFSHEHPLRLALFGITTRITDCKVCNAYVDGVGYGCITCKDFCIHLSCANLPQMLEHELHPQHQLVLSKAPDQHLFCFACHEEHRGGLAFYCVKCQFYMGAGCVSLKTTLKHPRHEHRLAYYKKSTNKLQCSCCGKRCRHDFYCCMCCNFNLHRDCLDHLPPTIDHKSHWHPLQLCDKFVYGRSDDQYCDYCEMIRNPDHGVYRCEECNFSTHIECMISNYKEEEKGSITIGSEKSNQLNIEIASVKTDIETKRTDLKAMEANLEISLDVLQQIRRRVTLLNGKRSDNLKSTIWVFPDKGLKSIFHKHPLNLRIISDNCKYIACHLCRIYPCECKDDKLLDALTAVTTLPPRDDEELNEGANEDEDEHITEEGKGKDDDEEEVNDVILHFSTPKEGGEEEEAMPVGVEEIIRHFTHEEHPKENDEDEDEDEVAVMPTTSVTQVEEGIIRHFSHTEHPLVSFHVEMQLHDRCGLCAKHIFGRFYGCRECIYLVHASCVVSPMIIHHHPFGSGLTLAQCRNYADEGKCRICADDIGGGFVYCHQDGSRGPAFTLHMACALSTGFPRGQLYAYSAEFKVHPLHPCPLVFFHIESGTYSPVKCKVCMLKISGEALGCPKCRFTLHTSCAEKLQNVLYHFLHSEHSLKLMQEPGDTDYKCGSCQQPDSPSESDIDMVFQCHICEFNLHPYCALKTLSAIEEGVATSISHFTHHHSLQLHFSRSGCCVVCEKKIYGLAYGCPTCRDMKLHKSCAEMSQELNHPYHPEHLLVLSKSPTGNFFHCSVCHNIPSHNNDYAYYCAKCEFYLDLGCATLNLTLKHPCHEHRLAYFTGYKGSQCNACGKNCEIDLYVCVLCDFKLHYDCLPLLPKIKHEGHRLHPLFLKDRFVDGDPNYQYCDHCETLRNPEHGVYHCGECWFSAHIDCMISKDKVEEREKKPEVLEAERARLEQEESELVRVEEVIDLTRMNIDAMRGSLEASTEKLRELDMEKESLSSS